MFSQYVVVYVGSTFVMMNFFGLVLLSTCTVATIPTLRRVEPCHRNDSHTGCCNDSMAIDGNCYECPEGKIGVNCVNNCVHGFFGYKCKERCVCLLYQYCNSIYGCLSKKANEKCPRAKQGSNCTDNCGPLRYGINCTEMCYCRPHEYCNPDKGCRNFELEKGGSSTVTSSSHWNQVLKNLINNPRFLIIALVSIVCVTIIIVILIILNKRASPPQRNERATRHRRCLSNRNDHRPNYYSQNDLGEEDSWFSRDDFDSCYDSLQESSMVAGDHLSSNKPSKAPSARICSVDEEPGCSTSAQGVTTSTRQGYHHLHGNFDAKSPKKTLNYDETKPASHSVMNAYSYNMINLKADHTPDDHLRSGYDDACLNIPDSINPQKETHEPKWTKIKMKADHLQRGTATTNSKDKHMKCKRKNNAYSLQRDIGVTNSKGKLIKSKRKNNAYSLQRDIDAIHSKDKSKSYNSKHKYSQGLVASKLPPPSNPYVRGSQIKRKASTSKGITGKVTIISRVSTLLSPQQKHQGTLDYNPGNMGEVREKNKCSTCKNNKEAENRVCDLELPSFNTLPNALPSVGLEGLPSNALSSTELEGLPSNANSENNHNLNAYYKGEVATNEIPSSPSSRRKNYSLARIPSVNVNDSVNDNTNVPRRKKDLPGQVTFISRLSNLFTTHMKPRTNVGMPSTIPDGDLPSTNTPDGAPFTNFSDIESPETNSDNASSYYKLERNFVPMQSFRPDYSSARFPPEQE